MSIEPTVLSQRDAELVRLRTFAAATERRHEAIQARIARVDLGRDRVDVVGLALDVLAILDGPAPGLSEYREVWDGTVPPGGFVCSVCGEPVESEPCFEHAPGTWQRAVEGLKAEQRHQLDDPALETAFARLAPRLAETVAQAAQAGGAR
ncbi:hypothetical protein [Streptomyces antibioticus]|uniref:hypothetical protein n=1 Tax=Streptomyces antibioticus TaxID=1890 RepID=UPI00340DE75C